MFGSPVSRAQKKAAKIYFTAGLMFLTAKYDRAGLDRTYKNLGEVTAELTPEQYAESFDLFWAKSARDYAPFFEMGFDPKALHDGIWHWAQTNEAPHTLRA